MPTAGPPKRSNYDRFIYILIGLAIGSVLAGFIVRGRQAAVAGGGTGMAAPPASPTQPAPAGAPGARSVPPEGGQAPQTTP